MLSISSLVFAVPFPQFPGSKSRMLKRGRPDDTNENAVTRLDWYEKYVAPALLYLKENPDFIYIPVDGERTIEDIHIDVMDKLISYI